MRSGSQASLLRPFPEGDRSESPKVGTSSSE